MVLALLHLLIIIVIIIAHCYYLCSAVFMVYASVIWAIDGTSKHQLTFLQMLFIRKSYCALARFPLHFSIALPSSCGKLTIQKTPIENRVYKILFCTRCSFHIFRTQRKEEDKKLEHRFDLRFSRDSHMFEFQVLRHSHTHAHTNRHLFIYYIWFHWK